MTIPTRSTAQPPDASLDSFETELLKHLRDHVSARAATPLAPAGRTSVGAAAPRRRPLIALAGTAAAAAVVALGVPLLASPAAYALQTADNGDITVTVTRLEDSAGLEAALAAKGIKAKVDYLPPGKACAPGRYSEVHPAGSLSAGVGRLPGASDPAVTFTISKTAWQPDWTLVLWHSGDLNAMTGGAGVASGPVGACQQVDLATLVPAQEPAGNLGQPGQAPRTSTTAS